MISQHEADQLFADAEREQERAAFYSDPDFQQVLREDAPALLWLRSYSGTFDFLLDMKARLISRKAFTERQFDAINRCYKREQDRLADQADRLLNEFYAPKSSLIYDHRFQHHPVCCDRPYGDHALDQGIAPPRRLEPVTEAGFFEHEGSIVKVQRAVHGSGNLYAKRLVIDEASQSGSFVYEAGLIRKLRESDRLTKERAAELGHLYGMCIVCGATLTDEKSIERGIGPICFGKL